MTNARLSGTRVKRKRGGQQGNQNARKHGFYAAALDPREICLFWSIANRGGADPELIALRIKLDAVFRRDPGNRRVLREAARLLAKWYRARYGLAGTANIVFKKLVRGILENIGAGG